MDFGLLGPLQVLRAGAPVNVGGPKQRAILAALLLRAGSVVPADHLIDEVWGEDPPESARNAVQVYVAQLRRALRDAAGGSPITTRPPGYVLDLSGHDDDLSRFRRLMAQGRRAAEAGDGAVAAAHFAAALQLWRGAPLADVHFYGDMAGIQTHLQEERLAAVEDRIDALLASGRHGEAVGELEELVAANPLRERLAHQLATALYRCGRQAEALEALQRARSVLLEELGLDPGPALRDLERAILRQDPSLERPAEAPRRTAIAALPRPLTRLLGRDDDVKRLLERLDATPLITLTGPGGTGKTRLALAVAHALAAGDAGGSWAGVWFVELAPLSDPAAVPPAVALALGVEEQPGEPPIAAVAARLHGIRTALVVDNCEHLADACAEICEQLLARCPDLSVLATSREALGLPGEVVWQVEPLDAPDPVRVAAGRSVWQFPAVELFVDRAREAVPGLQLTDDDAPAIARICTRLAGIPLAIELAAARVRALSVGQIAARLDAQLGLLTGRQRGRPDRQQTLRQTLDWSYDLLAPAERQLFARLAVFPAEFSLDAAEALCDADQDTTADVLETLDSLVGKSLVVARHGGSGGDPVRYRLLEPLRQYAAERLAQQGEADAVRERHARHFLALAECAEEALLGGPEQAMWFQRLEQERDNLRTAFEHFTARANAGGTARLACALWRFWLVHGPLSEGRSSFERALAIGVPTDDLRAKTLLRAGVFAHQLLDHARAAELYEQCTDLVAPGGPSALLADVLANRGLLAENQGRLAEAATLLEEALRLRRVLGDRHGLPVALDNLGQLKLRSGELAEARHLVREGCDAFRALGDLHGLSVALDNLGRIAEREGDTGGAAAAYGEALDVSRAIGDRWRTSYGLEGLGRVAAARGDLREAVALLAAAAESRSQVGDVLPPDAEAAHSDLLSRARQVLGPADFDAAWARGSQAGAAAAGAPSAGPAAQLPAPTSSGQLPP